MISTSAHSQNVETFVLDSWPFVEQMLKSAPIPRLETLIGLAATSQAVLLLSEVNLGEIFYLVAKKKDEVFADTALSLIARLPIKILPVASGDVLRAARLKARTTLSYADCFCAGLALLYSASIVTGDPDFLTLERSGLVRVDWVGA